MLALALCTDIWGKDVLGTDMFCRSAFEVLLKLRVRGGYE